jgi:hypothetical protein
MRFSTLRMQINLSNNQIISIKIHFIKSIELIYKIHKIKSCYFILNFESTDFISLLYRIIFWDHFVTTKGPFFVSEPIIYEVLINKIFFFNLVFYLNYFIPSILNRTF